MPAPPTSCPSAPVPPPAPARTHAPNHARHPISDNCTAPNYQITARRVMCEWWQDPYPLHADCSPLAHTVVIQGWVGDSERGYHAVQLRQRFGVDHRAVVPAHHEHVHRSVGEHKQTPLHLAVTPRPQPQSLRAVTPRRVLGVTQAGRCRRWRREGGGSPGNQVGVVQLRLRKARQPGDQRRRVHHPRPQRHHAPRSNTWCTNRTQHTAAGWLLADGCRGRWGAARARGFVSARAGKAERTAAHKDPLTGARHG